jgi:hypothetical protein
VIKDVGAELEKRGKSPTISSGRANVSASDTLVVLQSGSRPGSSKSQEID